MLSQQTDSAPLAPPSAPVMRRPQTPRSLPRCALVRFAALLALAAPSAAQLFEGEARVVEVRVPVTVTDRQGQPVRGLGPTDFELFDEGKLQAITGFEVVDLETLTAEAGTGAAGADQLASAARRHLLLLFDLSFSRPASILRARTAARELVLHHLHPADLAAVAVFTIETGPRLLVTFTPDRAQLARAIDTLGAPQLLEEVIADPLRFLIDTPQGAALASASAGAAGGASQDSRLLGAESVSGAALREHLSLLARGIDRSQKSFERGRITAWSRAMGDLGRALDSVAGRKQVIYFSEGFDSRLLLGRSPTTPSDESLRDELSILRGNAWMVDSDDLFGSTRLQREVGQMLDEFRRSDCVIQAVDIGGMRAGSDIVRSDLERGQEALFYIANETGGELFEEGNDLDQQLARVLQRSSVTYVLSFRPPDVAFDGSFRRLRVRLREGRGRRLAHRVGYHTPRPFPELHPLERDLLASDAIASAAPRDDVQIAVLAVPFHAGGGNAYVPVIVEMAGPGLLAGHEGPELQVEIYAYVTDRQGAMRDFFTQLVTLDLERGEEALRSKGVKYYGHLTLPAGDYLLRVLARNAASGRAGVRTVELHVPSFEGAAPRLLPPFVIERPGQWILVRENRPHEASDSVVYPFVVKGNPFIPAARPVLGRLERAEVSLFGYHWGDGAPQVAGRVRGSDGDLVAGGRLTLTEQTITGISGVHKLLASFQPRGLAAGNYILEVEVTTSAGVVQSSSLPFSVVD